LKRIRVVKEERQMLKSTFELFAIVLLLSTSAAQCQETADRFQTQLEPLIETLLRQQSVPGLAIGIVIGDKVVYAKGFGVKNLDRKDDPITTQSLFHMASITKLFVGTSVMQLVEQGKVSLDSPVVKYVPYFRMKDDRYKDITLRQMLTHTSGLPDEEDYEWEKPQYDDGALERYVRSLSNLSLLSAPGTNVAYSNMAYEILGDLISKVSGETFDDYVQRHILTPLGMKSSTLLLKEADTRLLTTGHVLNSTDDPVVSKVFPYNRMHSPSSNLHSNVVDMLRWAMANMNHGELDGKRILKASTYDTMWRPVHSPAEAGSGVGISWGLGKYHEFATVSHSGGDTGYSTDLMMIPEKQMAVVSMSNCDWIVFQLRPLSRAALDVALGFKPTPFAMKRSLGFRLYFEMKEKGVGGAIKKYRYLKANKRDLYEFDEGSLQEFGNYLLAHDDPKGALEFLRLNAEEYPSSSKAYASLAEAYARNGDKPAAIANYQRALKLDPSNSQVAEALKHLQN
jgi:CubicO group peptidase (beta-lactamase class C family)